MREPTASRSAGAGPEPPRGVSRLFGRVGRFRGLLAAGGAVLFISMVAHFRVPLLPDIGRDLGLSTFQLGLITTAFAAGRLVSDIPTGRLADRWSARRMFGVAAVALGLGSVLLAAAMSSAVTLVAGFLLGVSSAVANTTGMTLFSSSVSARHRGTAMAGFSASLLGGQALGPSVGGVLGGVAGWRGAQVIAGLAAFVGTAVIWRRRPRPARAGPARTGPDHGNLVSDRPSGEAGRLEQLVLYFVPFVMFFTLGSMPQTLVPVIGADAYALGAAVIGLALGLGGMCRFLGALVGGLVADRVSRKAALVPGMGLMAAGVALLAWDLGVWAWVASIVAMSLASFGMSVAATMLADHAGGRDVGRRLGPFRFVGDVGLVVGPTLTTAVFTAAGREAAVLGVAGLLAVCTILCGTVLRETRRASQDVTAQPTADRPGR